MMQTAPPAHYREEFARIARRRQEESQASERDRDRRRERTAAERDDDMGFEAIVVLATQEQLVAFSEKLDAYEARIVQELLDNEGKLTELRRQRDDLLERAFVLPDGKRAFKSQDGQRVVDETGAELGRDDIDPDQIPDGLPSSEAFLNIIEADAAIVERNTELQAGLDRIAEGRERSAQDGTTVDDLDAIMADLDATMADIRPTEPPALVEADRPRSVVAQHNQSLPSLTGGP